MTGDPNMNHTDVIKAIPDYVLGILDTRVASTVDEHLAGCASCAADVEAARVIHHVAASGAEPAPAGLRSNVLAAAFDARSPASTNTAHQPSREFAAWEAEIGRFRELLEHPLLGRRNDLTTGGWDTQCVAKFDLSIRSMVCHLIASESLRALQFGLPVDGVPETSRHIERRTRAAIERHSALSIAETIDEFERVTAWTGDQLRSLDLEQGLQGSTMAPGFTIDEYTALRALETWTHADDIRRALGEPEVTPEAVHISTMTNVLPRWITFVLSGAAEALRVRHYQIRLIGLTEQILDVAPPGSAGMPDVTMTCDAVEFCKLAGARRDPATFRYQATHPTNANALVHAMAEFELI